MSTNGRVHELILYAPRRVAVGVVGPEPFKGVELVWIEANIYVTKLINQDMVKRRRGSLIIIAPLG
jgi:hypothetical protein